MRRTRGEVVDPYLSGYQAPIHRALWERIKTWGAPRLLSAVWIGVCLYGVLFCLYVKQPVWIVAVAALWLIVQGIWILLTQWDEQFDDVLLALARYRTFYDAQ